MLPALEKYIWKYYEPLILRPYRENISWTLTLQELG